ncbi:MAG: hypothetical protein LBI88_06060 [Deltaproteobacteria bacterium]|jgi:HPt (histidine-containing phosphotransfer) domain-containing protein|nr:hypothetical protein [Deltaproteobacteria bacterium]
MSGWTARFSALAAFLALLVISSAWEMHTLRHDGEIRLQQDANILAKRASLYCAGISWEMDAPAARSSIFVEMEDIRLAGMLIYGREGLLEGMRRNRLWEPVPWDDLVPENSVEASASLMMEDVPVGEVVIYLSRRTLDEELSAKARRELMRAAALAVVPCIAMAQLLWQLAVRRATHRSSFVEHRDAPAAPLHIPPNWNNADVRQAYLDACRVFIRDQRGNTALLYQLAAREDWGELRATARALHEAALVLNAHPLAEAALSMQEAALAHTATAARHVENCIPALAQVLRAAEQLLRDNAASAYGENV